MKFFLNFPIQIRYKSGKRNSTLKVFCNGIVVRSYEAVCGAASVCS